MEHGIIATLVSFVVALYYTRFVALQWMKTDKSRPPMKFYYCVLVTIISSTFAVLYRLYLDYPHADEFLVFGWLFMVLTLAWMFYRVASQCPTVAEVFPFMARQRLAPAPTPGDSPIMRPEEEETKV